MLADPDEIRGLSETKVVLEPRRGSILMIKGQDVEVSASWRKGR